METIKMTVQEATEALLMSQSSVYSWIDRGRFKTEEIPGGKVIVISKNELEKIREYNLKSKRNKVAKNITSPQESFQESSVIDAEYSSNYEETVTNTSSLGSLELAKMISELSLKAGKYELLADMQREQKADAQYWRDEFFKLQNDYNNLQKQHGDVSKELLELKDKYKKPFSFFNRKI